AQIISPSDGSNFNSGTVTFNWSSGSGAAAYYMYVGTSFNSNDIYNSYVTNNSTTVSGIPTDGRTIYVTMWSSFNNVWQPIYYTYRSCGSCGVVVAELTSPLNNSKFAGGSVTFNWSGGSGPSAYYMYVGNSFNAFDIYNSYVTGGTTTVSGIPIDGRTIYVTLWSQFGGVWRPNNYVFKASGGSS